MFTIIIIMTISTAQYRNNWGEHTMLYKLDNKKLLLQTKQLKKLRQNQQSTDYTMQENWTYYLF